MNNNIEERYKKIGHLIGHIEKVLSHTVSCTIRNENKLYSGSWDGIIHIWNTETYEEIATLEGHTAGVIHLNLTLRENKLYTGSYDNTIRIWNI